MHVRWKFAWYMHTLDVFARVELLLWLTMDVYVNAQFGKS